MNNIEAMRLLQERINLLHSVINEQLIEAQNSDLSAELILKNIDQKLSASILSTGQTTFYDCELPHQPRHSFNNGYFCNNDSKHRFCNSHSLKKCPICGGDFK